MKTQFVQSVEANDGYFGDKCILHLCYDPETKVTLAVTPVGYFRTEIHLCNDVEEVRHLIENHPRYRRLQLI